MSPAGYSGKPLWQKLGLRPGDRGLILAAPGDYRALLDGPPDDLTLVSRGTGPFAFIHLFCRTRADLVRQLPILVARLEPAGMIWVSWPKKTSKVVTDITEGTIREVALPLGIVDVKVCAVDDVWSGLKLVIRKERRG